MKRYFEVYYPQRLKELKEGLEPIAKEVFAAIRLANREKQEEGIREFAKKVNLFVENTKLHVTSLSPRDSGCLIYLDRVRPEYLLKYFGEGTEVGKIYRILHQGKKE